MNEDPIGTSGGMNLYVYCNEDPISGSDQNGTNAHFDYYLAMIHAQEDAIKVANQLYADAPLAKINSDVRMWERFGVGLTGTFSMRTATQNLSKFTLEGVGTSLASFGMIFAAQDCAYDLGWRGVVDNEFNKNWINVNWRFRQYSRKLAKAQGFDPNKVVWIAKGDNSDSKTCKRVKRFYAKQGIFVMFISNETADSLFADPDTQNYGGRGRIDVQ